MIGARAFSAHLVEAALARIGYAGPDRELARGLVRDWARARLHRGALRGSFAGLQVVVPRAGRAELVPVEVPLARRGQITVEVLVSAISPGSERAHWLRMPNAQPPFPFRPGYSGAGRVVAVGPDATGFAPGDVVAIQRTPHASVATISTSRATRVPEGVEIEQAALVYFGMISGYGVRRAKIAAGDSVCVLGAGSMGVLAARLAKLAGAGRVTVVARSRRHEQSAAASGANFRLVNDDLADIAADVVIEGTGDPSAIADALAAARNGATIVLLGSPRGRSSIFIGDLQTCGLRLVGAHISALSAEARRTGDNLLQELATAFLDALAAGKLEVADLVGDPIDPREVGLIYRQLSDGLLERAYLDWSRIPTNERLCRRNVLQWPVLPPKGGSIRASPVQTVATPARPLRFAIFGCGDIGPANAKAVARANNAELVFVHDPVPALAEAVAAQHGGVVALAPEQAFDKECVDAVLLSVPHDVHAPLITKAAAAGLHVMVEKPLAVDLPTATAAVEACKAAGVTLSVCFPYRYEPAPAAALDLVKGGALGAFRGAAVTFHADKPQSYWHGGFSNRAFSNWRAKAPRAGGGVMIMNLTHYVDMLMHLTGCEAVEVSAVANVLPGQEVEDGIAVSVRFENGAVGTFLGSASTRGAPSSRMELWGEHGTLQLEPEPCIYTERAVPGLLTGRWNALPKDHVDVRRVLVERFASAVLDQREPDVTAGDGLAVQAFVDAVYRSMRSGRPEAVARVRVPR